MSSFTKPLSFAATDIFTGGSLKQRPVLLSGVTVMVNELVGARRLYEITGGFDFEDRRHGPIWRVEEGFHSDLGSIPGIARSLLSPDDPWAQAYVLHDWLYRLLRLGAAPAWLTRAKADLIMWDALGLPFQVYVLGEEEPLRAVCPAALRTTIYYAVRLAGGRAAVENS